MITTLSEKQIDIWLLSIADWTHLDLPQSFIEKLLSQKELERFNRFRPLSKKDEFIASRLLLHQLLSQYTDCNREKTEAVPDDMGRPFWLEHGAPLDTYFSLSHTAEMICCAVSKIKEIGCDVESLARRKYEKDLTKRVFSKEEQQYYMGLPEERQTEFFYRSWTLKEAFIKAIGQGMRVPLTSLSFTYQATGDITFMVMPKNLGEKWSTTPYTFVSSIPKPGYSLGIASPIVTPEINYKTPRIEDQKIIL